MAGGIEKGRKIGQYEVRGTLGVGGMASVYRAYQPSLDREVAIKLMAEQYARDPTFVERFRREARSVARLRHPNILTVYDAGEEDGMLYIVMEMIEGQTLKEELHGRPMAVDKALSYTEQVAGALDYASQKGIVHRDIKPSNVLIDASGRAVLADFGIAKMAAERDNQLTGTGTGVGTPDYMSPEQALGEELDARSDQYSLAVMLYELLTGRTPFTGDTPIAVVMGHVSKPLPSARQLNPQIPATVEAVLVKALSKKAVDRYESSGAFSQALQNAWRDRNNTQATFEAQAETQAVNYGGGGGAVVNPHHDNDSGPFNPEAEGMYAEARRLEGQNNFRGAFDVFGNLDRRFPRYKDVPGILERYRAMGYAGPTGPGGWQNIPPVAGSYSGSYGGGPGYGGTPPQGFPVGGTNSYGPGPGPYYGAGVGPGPTPPKAKGGFPLIPAIIGIVVLAAAAIIGLIVVAGGGSGNKKDPTADPNPLSNVTPPNVSIGALPTPPKFGLVTPGAGTPKPIDTSNLKYARYKDPNGHWEADVPDTWEDKPDGNGVSFTPKDNPLTTVGIVSEDLADAGGVSQSVVDVLLNQYLTSAGGKIDRTEKRKVDGSDATVSIGTITDSGITLNLKLISLVKDGRLYLLVYAALPGLESSSEPIFERFVNSIKFS